jgi:hypothetical protein
VRTWEDNRRAINELWPLMELKPEEKKLWTDDLSALDQAVLYDAIRNVKRGNDTNYPQLKWILDEYRSLHRVYQSAQGRTSKAEPRKTVEIDPKQDERLRAELMELIGMASPAEYETVRDLIVTKAHDLKIEMATAFRLCRYLNDRTGRSQGGRPDAA